MVPEESSVEEEDEVPRPPPRLARGRDIRQRMPRPRRTSPPVTVAARGDPEGAWSVENNFYPLPPAPWYEPDDDVQYVSAIDNFNRYIPDELLENMAQASSANMLSERGVEMPLTADDMKKFFGVQNFLHETATNQIVLGCKY